MVPERIEDVKLGAHCEIREPTIRDVEYMAQNLRPEDQEEIRAFTGGDPVEAVKQSARESEVVWMLFYKGLPAILAGAVPRSPENIAVPWLVGTKALNHRVPVRRSLVLASQAYLNALLARYEYLFNYVATDNFFSIHWLAWMGFQFGYTAPVERGGKTFVHFFYLRGWVPAWKDPLTPEPMGMETVR